jgi:hypothetical protein
MKRALLVFSVVALLTTPAAAAPHRITYIAYRGGALEVPENTMEGLVRLGCDGVVTDAPGAAGGGVDWFSDRLSATR